MVVNGAISRNTNQGWGKYKSTTSEYKFESDLNGGDIILVRGEELRMMKGVSSVDEQRTTVVLAHGCSSPPPLPIYLPNPRDGFETAHAPVLLPAHSGTIWHYGDRMGNLRIYPMSDKSPRSPRNCESGGGGCASQYNGISVIFEDNAELTLFCVCLTYYSVRSG
jgi:hypothetical protein